MNTICDSKKVKVKFKFVSSNGITFESEEDGKIKCGKCSLKFQRILSHLTNSCAGVVTTVELEKLKHESNKFNKSKKQKKWLDKVRFECQDKFNENKKEQQKRWEDKIKSEIPEKFKESKSTRQRKWKDKAKSEIPGKFEERQTTHQKKWEDKAKSETPEKF